MIHINKGQEFVKISDIEIPIKLAYRGNKKRPPFYRSELKYAAVEWVNKNGIPINSIKFFEICQNGEIDSMGLKVNYKSGHVQEDVLPGGNINYWCS